MTATIVPNACQDLKLSRGQPPLVSALGSGTFLAGGHWLPPVPPGEQSHLRCSIQVAVNIRFLRKVCFAKAHSSLLHCCIDRSHRLRERHLEHKRPTLADREQPAASRFRVKAVRWLKHSATVCGSHHRHVTESAEHPRSAPRQDASKHAGERYLAGHVAPVPNQRSGIDRKHPKSNPQPKTPKREHLQRTGEPTNPPKAKHQPHWTPSHTPVQLHAPIDSNCPIEMN